MIRGPKRKKLGHFGFSTSKLRSGQQIAFGRQPAPGRRIALGPAMRVRPAIRVRPTVGVWPGKTRLASKARFTSRIRTMLHQQGDFPPANALTTSKPTSRKQARSPNALSHSGAMPTGEQAGPDGTPPKALNTFDVGGTNLPLVLLFLLFCRMCLQVGTRNTGYAFMWR